MMFCQIHDSYKTYLFLWIFCCISIGSCVAGTSTLHSVILPKNTKGPKDRLKTGLSTQASSQNKYHDTTVLSKSNSESHSGGHYYKDDIPYFHDNHATQWRHHGYEHYPSHYETIPYHPHHHLEHKSYDHFMWIPLVLGGIAVVGLPLLTLFLTLMVNVAPASNIPTAITTTTGKKRNLPNMPDFMELLQKLDEALSGKFDELNDAKQK